MEINSPRTLHACAILGLDLKELEPVDLDGVIKYYQDRDHCKKVPQEFVDLRYKMLDQRRYDKQKLIAEERNKLIYGKESKTSNSPKGPVTRYNLKNLNKTIDHQSQNFSPDLSNHKNSNSLYGNMILPGAADPTGYTTNYDSKMSLQPNGFSTMRSQFNIYPSNLPKFISVGNHKNIRRSLHTKKAPSLQIKKTSGEVIMQNQHS